MSGAQNLNIKMFSVQLVWVEEGFLHVQDLFAAHRHHRGESQALLEVKGQDLRPR